MRPLRHAAVLRAWVLVIAGIAGTAGSAQAAVDVKSTLTPDLIGVDEVATFTIEVHGTGFGRVDFQPSFEMDNLEIAAGPFHSESVSFVNGSFSRSYRVSWQLRPQRVGRARVHSIVVHLNDQRLDLPGRDLRVQQQPTRPPADQQEEEDPLDRFFGGGIPLRRLFEPPPQQPNGSPRVFLRA
ncbi:MAG TPA: BatD family protein, partial [Thermoanaerobaculia bacterium]|nr:BatD family protein [Thermoanaerobaculia bacterium]